MTESQLTTPEIYVAEITEELIAKTKDMADIMQDLRYGNCPFSIYSFADDFKARAEAILKMLEPFLADPIMEKVREENAALEKQYQEMLLKRQNNAP